MKHSQSSAVSAPVGVVPGGFGLYIHWPFCTTKCPYCDFNSHLARSIDVPRWTRAYAKEIDRMGRLLPGRTLDTIFFGGGTPSLMPPAIVSGIITVARKRWAFAPAIEITLEANPGSSDLARFSAFRDAGVNRLSLGIQSLRDEDLRSLGRTHNASNATKAYEAARQVFPRVSCDLIYGRQHQSPASWERELSEVLSMRPDHLSLYQLTVEDGTVFARRHAVGQLPGLPDEVASVDFYEITSRLCSNAGLKQYEISNWAQPGHQCAHNLIYWRSGDFVGIGPGAHGRLTIAGERLSTEQEKDPKSWLHDVLNDSGDDVATRSLSRMEWATEYVLMGLRLAEGISLERFRLIAGHGLSPTRISELVRTGYMDLEGDALACTDKGRILLDAILRELLTEF